MELKFSMRTITPKGSLDQKLREINLKPGIERIFAKVAFVRPDSTKTIPIDAIFDTGAIVSLFPDYLLKELPSKEFVEHTFWGIVSTPECQVKTKLALIDLVLIDRGGIISPSISLPVAFASSTDLQPLLGMKGLLSEFRSCIDPRGKEFILMVH